MKFNSKCLKYGLTISPLLVVVCAFVLMPSTEAVEGQTLSKSEAVVPPNAKLGFKTIYSLINDYKLVNDGMYPKSLKDVIDSLSPDELTPEDVARLRERFSPLTNPDAEFSDDPITKKYAKQVQSYTFLWARPNGNFFSNPRPKNTIDVQAYTTIYSRHQVGKLKQQGEICESFMGGYYSVDTEGAVSFTSPDDIYLYYRSGVGLFTGFPKQAGMPFETITQSESFLQIPDKIERVLYKPESAKDQYVLDNGGPESLKQLSGRLDALNSSGFRREEVWTHFDPAQAEFTLQDVQSGGMKLGLNTQIRHLLLPQLQGIGTPALLFLRDDGRIVTLTALDADRAVVIDRGVTLNVERSILERRYSGEVLVPTKSLTQNAAIVADDAVREVKLPSLESELPEQFTLRNAGTTPITLRLEYPLLGVTESKLSQDVIAPGETATLDLKVKWRSILDVPYQNVLVSIATSDPIVPRLQLAVLLTPPKEVK